MRAYTHTHTHTHTVNVFRKGKTQGRCPLTARLEKTRKGSFVGAFLYFFYPLFFIFFPFGCPKGPAFEFRHLFQLSNQFSRPQPSIDSVQLALKNGPGKKKKRQKVDCITFKVIEFRTWPTG